MTGHWTTRIEADGAADSSADVPASTYACFTPERDRGRGAGTLEISIKFLTELGDVPLIVPAGTNMGVGE